METLKYQIEEIEKAELEAGEDEELEEKEWYVGKKTTAPQFNSFRN